MHQVQKVGFGSRSTPRSTLWSTWSLGGRLGPGWEISRPACSGFWIRNFELFSILKISETSEGHISLIRTSILANSDSFPSSIPRRTQWHSLFPLIRIFKLNSASIYVITGYWKYGLLHSPLLKGFRPRNLQVRKNVSYQPTSIYSKHHPRAIIVLTRF